jgi:folate-binding protein YgfZ
MAVLAVEGPDRAAFLQGQLTQDVRALSSGGCLPAAGLTAQGKLLYFGRLVAEPERLLLLLEGGAAGALAHLSKYAAFQKTAVRDVTAEFLSLGLYGPGAPAIEPPAGAILLPPDGEFSAEILAAASARAALDALLAAAGSLPVSPEQAEAVRVEAGRPLFGKDADGSNLPDEVGLQKAIAAAKGCYVGQEVVARLRTYGRLQRRLVGFRFPRARVPAGTCFPDPEKAGRELARVTSSAVSPRLGPIGLGLASRDVPEGATLTLPGNPERAAVLTALPFP